VPTRPLNEAKLQKALLAAEREIGRLEGKLNEISDALTVAGIDADTAAIERLGTEYARVEEELGAAYARWEALGAQAGALAGMATVG
jgi:hypothetical protein